MFAFSTRFSSRSILALALGSATLTAAGAATLHRLAVSQGGGSEGATSFLQTGTGSALQGEVAASVNASIGVPFGVLGEYNPSGSTFGAGVLGISTTGYGIAAEALSSQPSFLAIAGGTGIALESVTPSSSAAESIYAEAEGTGDGADLYADKSGYGVYGANVTSATPAPTDPPSRYSGVYGVSNTGTGVYGVSKACNSAPNCRAYGIGSQLGAGVFGLGNSGPGVEGYSNYDYALYGLNQGNSPTVYIENETGTAALGTALEIEDDATGALTIAYSSGDFYSSGSISSGTDTFNAVTRNPASDRMTYAALQTEATVEDVGHAQLVSGNASVALAPDFRETINSAVPYDVFLTPYGDTRGLYVASRTPAGFTVRENQGGRSTLAFSYRVVAQPYGTPHERLPHLHRRLKIPMHGGHELARMRTEGGDPQLRRGVPPPIAPGFKRVAPL